MPRTPAPGYPDLVRVFCRKCGSLFLAGTPVGFPAYCPRCIIGAPKPITRPVPKKKDTAAPASKTPKPDPPAEG